MSVVPRRRIITIRIDNEIADVLEWRALAFVAGQPKRGHAQWRSLVEQ